jgi:integrase/recombinase XerD
MVLAFSTEDYVFGDRPRPGFPLLLGDDMEPAEPFHSYLKYRLLEQGKGLDVKTWEAYGRRLWDFAAFLHANDLAWNRPFSCPGESVVQIYRDWQVQDLKLQPSTINDRLKLVSDLYCWATERKLIDRLPFAYSDTHTSDCEYRYAHTPWRSPARRPSVLLDEWDDEPAFLTIEQVKIARASIRSTSHRLLFDLMVRTGLRSVEARTFPLKYVFSPATRPDLRVGVPIASRLDPRDMQIKFKKSRVIHIPYGLMQDMHTYAQFERNRLAKTSEPNDSLLLTVCGNTYSKESAHKAMHDLGHKVGFDIRPLMLRHSYAIHTLLWLKANPILELEPLLYVRDRLGHSDVRTTVIYLRQIERLIGAEALAMMEEFDSLYVIAGRPANGLCEQATSPVY